jgi:hypothetical protein
MPEITKEEAEQILTKYKSQLSSQLEGTPQQDSEDQEPEKPVTQEYQEFKDEQLPRHFTVYEKYAKLAGQILKIKPDEKKAAEYQEAIDTCHLDITPTDALSFSFLAPGMMAFLGVVLSIVFFQASMFMIIFFVGASAGMMLPFQKIPQRLAQSWRMAAGNQMVLCSFYIVSFMRHTPNLELAVEFASKHLTAPLSLDLRKVIWDVETEKYENIKESFDSYLNSWKKYNQEFIESIHLIESSLYEGAEDRRLQMLDKSLTVILEETYEKMLHYAQNLKSPITMLHMLGIILPILGLVILPLMVSFMDGVQWFHISAIYNMGLPFMVYYMGTTILSTRPSGHGSVDVKIPEEDKNKISFLGIKLKMNPLVLCLFIAVTATVIGFSPIMLHTMGVEDFGFGEADPLSTCGQRFCFMGYKESQKLLDPEGNPIIMGPFGMGASLLSIAIIFGIGFSIGLYYKFKSGNVIEIRNKSMQLEQEFASALFQLGNRLGDGIPVEIAFSKVAVSMEGTASGEFFQSVSDNISRQGMSVDTAIFDKEHGALVAFPSSLIESSMKVLTESSKRGPVVASQALINISQYIKQMHTVDERLKDLMAETISSMKSQIKFLTPVIAGIVIGITSMISTILGKLSKQMSNIQEGSAASAGGAPTGLADMFGDGLPTFYFQLIVGMYVIQIAYILTVLTNGIENGSDKTAENYQLGINMTKASVMYCGLATIVMLAFNAVAGSILGK